jgi:hypothetical protein
MSCGCSEKAEEVRLTEDESVGDVVLAVQNAARIAVGLTRVFEKNRDEVVPDIGH